MNSKALQQVYPDIYRHLFSQCPLVLSAPLGFYWVEHPTAHYNGVMLRQKLPTKVFLGIEFTQKSTIEFGSLQYFSNSRQTFSFENINNYWPNRIEFFDYLTKRFKKVVLEKKGICFHILVEDNLYSYPIGVQGVISALIASALLLLSNELNINQIHRWSSVSPKLLLKDEQLGFSLAFNLTRTINSITKKAYTWNTGVFAALVPTPYTVIAFPGSQVRMLDYEFHKNSDFNSVATVPFWGYDLSDLYPDLPKESPVWPIDFGSIFSGKAVLAGHTSLKGTKTNYDTTSLQAFIRQKFASDVSSSHILPDFYESFGPGGSRVNHYDTDLLSTISIRLIDQLYRLLAHGYSENEINNFINLLQARHSAVMAIDDVSDHMRKVLQSLNSALFKYNPSGNFALFAMYDVTLGGSIGFVGPVNMYRDCLEEAVKELQKDYPDISADYLSWRDGYSSDGLIVEQYLNEGIISNYVNRSSVKITEYRFDRISEKIHLLEAVDMQRYKNDILVNIVDHTLCIGDDPVSSKELHSQIATVHLLSNILQAPEYRVASKELPRSAYTISKNEMQGKIIGPLCWLVEKRLGKKLDIRLSGTNTEFSVVLRLSSEISIILLQSLF